jgi:transcriptional regulator with XRE-family HTH domain
MNELDRQAKQPKGRKKPSPMTPSEKSRAAPTGRKYSSVASMMQNEGIPKPIQTKVTQMLNDSRIATQMAQLRHRAGITQQQMAKALGVTQSAISKLEAGKDDDITLNQVKEYARITGDRISLLFGKPFSHTEAVKLHANGLKYRLDELAKTANQNPELQSEIKGFLGDAFFNLFNIISLCNDQLPIDDEDDIEEIKMEIS